MEEIWKDIPNALGYQISNFGNIKSIEREIAPAKGSKPRISKGRVLKPSKDKDGYLMIQLGKFHPYPLSRKIHRLVLLAFVGESTLEVNHIDGNKQNNRLDNLEYVTHSQNHIHCRKVLKKLTGVNHWNYRGL